jgi:uncharacterized NAD(P)/FAD-binding protein YdhS
LRHVAIIGGGFSGALLAINLLRHDGPRATLIERRPYPGRGTAYSTVHPEHLLNVRAGNMSAFPDAPDDFAEWLRHRSGGERPGFAPRRVYGDYLEELLATAAREAPGRLEILLGDAVDMDVAGAQVAVRLSDGGIIDADAAVLAIGNLPPLPPTDLGEAVTASPAYADDPWRGDFGSELGDADTVMILGTGLTMIDVVLSLDANGFGGRIVALSRRGLLPHAHEEGQPSTSRPERPPVVPSELVRDVRARSRQIPWRAAVDELRPYTQDIWQAMSIEDRARALRHLRPWWDVHRHRIAPAVAERLTALRASGRLDIVAGKLLAVDPAEDGLAISLRRRGSDRPEALRVKRLINATGPAGSLRHATEPLLRSLRDRGLVRPDPLDLGVDVGMGSQVIDARGEASDQLFMIGPMTRGAFWEIVAVPDIRKQAWSLARRLSNAHWVEGSGL